MSKLEFFGAFLLGLGLSVLLSVVVLHTPNDPSTAHASGPKQLRIAIIDTGYKHDSTDVPLKLCKDGHYDLVKKTPTIGYSIEHGTRVANIIAENLQNVDYCAVIFQLYGPDGIDIQSIGQAVIRAIDAGVDVINISLTGNDPDFLEERVLEQATLRGIKVFQAAGNYSTNLDNKCDLYPACYKLPGVTVVGALDYTNGLRARYSNYGSLVKEYYNGYSMYHNEIDNGTSYATPRALSNYVLKLYNQQVRMIK